LASFHLASSSLWTKFWVLPSSPSVQPHRYASLVNLDSERISEAEKGRTSDPQPGHHRTPSARRPHLRVATLTGVAPDSVWQGDYLLKGLEHLNAYGTVAPAAADHTVGAALKLIDSATRTDYGVGIGRCIGLLFHCIPFSSTHPKLSNLVLFEPFRFVHSDLPVTSPCAGGRLCVRRLMGCECRYICHMDMFHMPHGQSFGYLPTQAAFTDWLVRR
jgi:hypothetical protein